MRLIVAEKPSLHKQISLALDPIEAEGLSNVHLFYKFDYSDYTFLSQPAYQHDGNTKFNYRMAQYTLGSVNQGESFNLHEATRQDFIKYSEIFLLIEADHSAVRAADLFLDHVFGASKESYPVTFGIIMDYLKRDLKKAFNDRLDYFKIQYDSNHKNKKAYAAVERYRKTYQIKDYIDFNFNGMLLKYFYDKKEVMTRNKIMMLILLQKFTFRDSMQAQESTFSQMQEHNIGSPASKSEIMTSLIAAKLVSPELYKVTKLGLAFIDTLPDELRSVESLMEFQRIERAKLLHEDKMKAAQQHLEKIFACCLNKN